MGVSVSVSDEIKFGSVNEVTNKIVRDFSEIERADALRTTSPWETQEWSMQSWACVGVSGLLTIFLYPRPQSRPYLW